MRSHLQGLFNNAETFKKYDERVWDNVTCTDIKGNVFFCTEMNKSNVRFHFHTLSSKHPTVLRDICYYSDWRGMKYLRVHTLRDPDIITVTLDFHFSTIVRNA